MYSLIDRHVSKNIDIPRNHKMNFELYIGKKLNENVFDISLSNKQFINTLKKMDIHKSSFYKQKNFYKNYLVSTYRNGNQQSYESYLCHKLVSKKHNIIILSKSQKKVKNNSLCRSNYNHMDENEIIEINYDNITIYFIHSFKNYYIKIVFNKNTNLSKLCKIIETLSTPHQNNT